MHVAYEQAVEEATQAFLEVMDLRGFGRKGELHDFQTHMLQATEYSFHVMAGGPDEDADRLVPAMISISEEPIRSCILPITKNED